MSTKVALQVTDLSVRPENDNFLLFTATAGFIGKPTRATPCGGSKGYSVILADGANVEELNGSGVNCSYGADGFKAHDKFFKIGVIDDARVSDGDILVEGHLWKADFPDVCDTIESAKDALGCSVEVYSYAVDVDDDARTQTLNDVHFTGMSIVYKNKAAFEGTRFMCSIAEKETNILSDLKIKEIVDAAVGAKFEELKESLRAEFAQQFEDLKQKDAKIETVEKEIAKENDVNKEMTSADFAAVGDIVKAAVKEAVSEWAVAVDEKRSQAAAIPTRKTQLFASEPKFKPEKTIADLSKEIDDNPNLTTEQKWAAKMNLWNGRNGLSA